MSGYTKPDLKRFAKSGSIVQKFLANEVLTLRELAGEARKDARRAADEMLEMHAQLSKAEKVVEAAQSWNHLRTTKSECKLVEALKDYRGK